MDFNDFMAGVFVVGLIGTPILLIGAIVLAARKSKGTERPASPREPKYTSKNPFEAPTKPHVPLSKKLAKEAPKMKFTSRKLPKIKKVQGKVYHRKYDKKTQEYTYVNNNGDVLDYAMMYLLFSNTMSSDLGFSSHNLGVGDPAVDLTPSSDPSPVVDPSPSHSHDSSPSFDSSPSDSGSSWDSSSSSFDSSSSSFDSGSSGGSDF